jgi:hypothetical protein
MALAYLLRKLSNIDEWADAADSDLWAAGDCPPAVLKQVFDNRDGVSTWRVTTEEEIERVVAAQALMRSSIGDFAYCLIDEEKLAAEGFARKDTPQRTVDRQINDKHVDLVNLAGKKVIRLAQLINSECDPLVMSRMEILEAAARFFTEGQFDRAFLFTGGNKGRSDEEIEKAKDLLVNLWKKQELNLTLRDGR